jgi:SSS family transporter
MEVLDWVVLLGTLLFIALYGAWKTRKSNSIDEYLKGGNQLKWATIGLSVMATQASAITFLSAPGQAYESGLSFIQNYFGLPIALIIVSAFFIPLYYRLKVFTAYEFLENRFDLKTRLLAAFLFLIQRGLAAGITIYAPSIILSSALGWDLYTTVLTVGVVVIIYTVSGGSKAVSLTQKWQMGIVLVGMVAAFFCLLSLLPDQISFNKALKIAGTHNKLNAISFSLDPSERYTIWTGLTGGLFLALSYFGTDQSQVQRYLGGKSVKESRLGLMFNAVLKIPMQFFILLTGVFVFVFFQFERHPLLFNQEAVESIHQSDNRVDFQQFESEYEENWNKKRTAQLQFFSNQPPQNPAEKTRLKQEIQSLSQKEATLKNDADQLIKQSLPDLPAKDSDYIFLHFIMNYLPNGLIGLLLAVILAAAMSSTAGELNALGSTTTVDFYQRLVKKDASPTHFVLVSRLLTVGWGIIALCFALFASMVENLIEAVNILGSIFYGTILGVFVAAFFIKVIKAKAVFYGAVLGQCIVIFLFWFYAEDIAYLWYNLIGCALVLLIALILTLFKKEGIEQKMS